MKRLISFLLALCLLPSLLCPAALAADPASVGDVLIRDRSDFILEPPPNGSPGSQRLYAYVTNADAPDTSIDWSSSNEDVATVSPEGYVTAVGPGKSIITASAHADPTKTDSCTVTVSGIVFPESTVETVPGGGLSVRPDYFGNAAEVIDWEWECDDHSVAAVSPASGTINANYIEGEATISCTSASGLYSASFTLVVARNKATIRTSMEGRSLSFSDLPLDSRCQDMTGADLSYITSLAVSPDQGTLYYGYVSEGDTGNGVAGSRRYYNGSGGPYRIGDIIFAAKSDFAGEAIIRYTGYTTSGVTYSGEILVQVEEPDEVAYSSEHGEAIHFRAENFSQYCQLTTGRPVSYVTFSAPADKYGYLYYNYSSGAVYESNVPADTKYYRTSNPSIDSVSFIPAEGYTGSFTLSFRGADTAGMSFAGIIRITVGSDGTGGGINYTVRPGRQVYFDDGDFSDACYDATDRQLTSITFNALPPASQGTLYYDGDIKVNTSTAYYRAGSSRRLIEDVCFLADEKYTGSVSIPFTGTASDGTSFTATVRIDVSDDASHLSYSVEPGDEVYFDDGDFSDACYDATDRQLSYVRFTSLPTSSRGTLYYDGSTKVTTSTAYYYAGSSRSKLLEDVSFQANSRYTGTFSIPFTGCSTSGERFKGSVTITVTDRAESPGITGSGSSGNVSYYTSGAAVYFRASDFSDACRSLLAAPLSKIRITAPPVSAGTLYLNYTSPTRNTVLSPGRDCPVSTLSQVAFVPKAGYSGTLSLYFTGTDQQGNTCGTTFQIRVSPAAYSQYFSDMTYSDWAVQSVDFLHTYGVVYGTTSYTYSPLSPMKRGDFVLMLSRAFSFPNAGTEGFPDVPQSYHSAAAIASAKALGIVTGDAGGNFRPEEAITRQEAGVMLYRCLLRQGSITAGAAADLAQFSDRAQVSASATAAMGALVREGIFEGDGGTLAPRATLNRAQMAAILHRALT